MGTSRITLITGVYVVLGLYIFGFNSADETTSKLAYTSAVKAQAEQLAQTGVSMALINLGSSSAATISSASKSTMGGTVSYSATDLSGQRKITSNATIGSGDNAVTVTTTSIASFDKGRWRIQRTYID